MWLTAFGRGVSEKGPDDSIWKWCEGEGAWLTAFGRGVSEKGCGRV